MVAKASYIKNRPDLPGPPSDPADSDVSVLRPPIPPLEEAVADAAERVEETPPDLGRDVGPAGDPDRTLVEGGDPVGRSDEPVRQRRSKSGRAQRSKKPAGGEGGQS